ncbi:MAG: GreA/GreB family elongation factor [Candidatus Eisenbacteria bacterium]
MPVRDTLPAILRGDELGDLSPSSRDRLESIAHEAQAEGRLAWVREECGGRLRQPKPSHAVEYLLAAVCALNGDIERANQTLLALGEKLAAEKAWEPLASVAERSLQLAETGAGARLLVKAHEGLGKDPERVDALGRAFALIPEDLELGLLLAVRLADVGRAADRRALLAELTPAFAAEKRYPGLEEAALEFAEHEDLDGLVKLGEVLPTVAQQGALKEVRLLADITLPPLVAAHRAGELEASLRRAVAEAVAEGGEAGAQPLRASLIEALRQGPGRDLPDAARVIADSGLADPEQPVLGALERFDQLAALPPGRVVFHGSFGGGRVLSNDGETVVLDFARSRGHKMPYAAARRTLAAVADDDLRLLHLGDPAELKRLRDEQPAAVLARALRAMGGSADAQKLKTFLVGYQLIPAGEWTSFLRRMRSAAEKDPRIDHSRAFEQVWALAPEGTVNGAGAVDTPLPLHEPRKPARHNLANLRKFLVQHPQAERTLLQRFGRFIERTMLDEEGERVDRARAGLYFARWYPHRASDWLEVLKQLWEQGLSITDLSGEDEQAALLDAAHAPGVEADAILSALDSRFSSVRDKAQVYHDHLDDAGRAALRVTLLEHAPRYPAAALRLIEQELGRKERPTDGWRVLWGALSLIEEKPKPSTAEKVLSWLEPGGAFDRLLAGMPCPEDRVLKTTVLLRQWRSSDRYLFPALDAAGRYGLSDAVEAVKLTRQKNSQRMFAQVGQQVAEELPVMTRATWNRLKKELDRLERELRTTIPQTIQRARELGDLRENAEYHSAKLKQKTVSAQVAMLQQRLVRARFVDDAMLKDGVVGLGTEVVVENDREMTTYWILGEDEHHHGDHVISFQSAVGRALMGKGIGDEVDLPAEEQVVRYRVVSVERKLPPHEAGTAPVS